MSTFEKIYKIFGYIKRACLIISGIGIGVMILLITIDVISRNFFSYGIPGSYEITESILMPTAIFWALLITYASGSIPRIDMLMNKFKGSLQLTVGIMLVLIDIFIYSLMTYYGWSRAEIAFTSGASISAGGTLIGIELMFLFVPIGFLFVTLEAIFILIKMIKDKNYHYSIDKENEPMQD